MASEDVALVLDALAKSKRLVRVALLLVMLAMVVTIVDLMTKRAILTATADIRKDLDGYAEVVRGTAEHGTAVPGAGGEPGGGVGDGVVRDAGVAAPASDNGRAAPGKARGGSGGASERVPGDG